VVADMPDASGVTLELAADLPALALDRMRIRLLVRNLLDNALRFAPDAGRVRAVLRREDGGICLEVEDSGPGVAPELRSRIFDRFFRGPDGRGEGSGLGLSIARRVVELHRGTIAASASPSLGGLRVSIRLPATT
jgi:signal transduction histidine kinase